MTFVKPIAIIEIASFNASIILTDEKTTEYSPRAENVEIQSMMFPINHIKIGTSKSDVSSVPKKAKQSDAVISSTSNISSKSFLYSSEFLLLIVTPYLNSLIYILTKFLFFCN